MHGSNKPRARFGVKAPDSGPESASGAPPQTARGQRISRE
jgi:hypothetical protein